MEINRESLLTLIQSGLKRDALSIAGLEKQAGVPKDTVRDFLRAKTQVLRADKLQKVLRVLQPEPHVTVSGYVGVDAELFFFSDTAAPPLHVPVPPGFFPTEVTAVRIQGDAMMPVFHDGWIVYYHSNPNSSVQAPLIAGGWQVPYNPPPATPDDKCAPSPRRDPWTEFLGKPAIIGLKDGRALLRTLKRGNRPHRYNLVSYNAGIIENAVVEWVAKIIFIKT